MSEPPGAGQQRPEAAETEDAFRERLLHAVVKWQQRLAQAQSPPSPEPATIAREAAMLRGVAQSRGWSMAQHLLYLENIAQNAPASLAQALGGIANALRVAVGTISPFTVRIEPPAGQRSPSAATCSSSPGVRSTPTPSVPLPSSMGGSAAPPAPPPLLSERREPTPQGAAPWPDATMHSAKGGLDSKSPPPAPASPPPRKASPPPARRPAEPLPDSMARPRVPPSLFARSMLGLRAFRRNQRGSEPVPGARPGEPAGDAPLFGFRRLPSDPARPAPVRLPSLSPSRPPSRSPGEAAPPRRLSWPARGTDPPPLRGEERSSGTGVRAQKRAASSDAAAPRWFYALIGALGFLGVGTIATVVVLGRRATQTTDVKGLAPSVSPPPALSPAAAQPAPDTPSSVEQVSLAVHKHGAETPELRALLDLQGRLASSCRDDHALCGRGWTPLAKEALTPVEIKDFTPSSADLPLAAWLKRLKLPRDLPVRDEAALRGSFDFNTKNIAGRQGFQARLFECSAYSDIFDATFIKYGAPSWLTAVVYQESGCNPRAMSPVGARGLWQFMPESARVYGLRVVDGDVDERLNPVKSTDAAVHFLTDLQRKLGAWDLTLAAYNMGPFAVVARVAQMGGSAGFWDLVHARVLPEETAGYVPAIEAYALILDNISRLQFSRDGKRLESTAEVVVKPGTRLSLIARASATTTVHIRELNPEFLRDVVPEGETTARVPDAEVHRAQAFLENWAPEDDRDTCVPEDFDWGAKQFERSPYAKECARRRATGPPP